MDELSMKQQRNPHTVNQLMAQIKELQDKAASLTDASDFHDPETASPCYALLALQRIQFMCQSLVALVAISHISV